ncbi:MAG: methyltransferase domain-containing protein [Ardenticatenaceae bacterium]|nr:methyltransferase domain-containing protein [Ardenticatenaceae bacterium]
MISRRCLTQYPQTVPGGFRERQEHPELLDGDHGTLAEVAESLDDLTRINTCLFGIAATLDPLKRRVRAAPKPVSVLDLGTGNGHLACALANWAFREHIALRLLAADVNPRHVAVAAAELHRAPTTFPPRPPRGGVHLLAADGRRVPLADNAVDYVISSLLLHHLAPEAVVALLRECRRVARRGLVMTDLIRHPVPYWLFRLVRPLLVRSPITRHDSEASFRRGYTPAELRRLAAQALADPQVSVHLPSTRLLLTSDWG